MWGNILMEIKENLSQDIHMSVKNSSSQFRYLLDADFNNLYIYRYNHLDDKNHSTETVYIVSSTSRIFLATLTLHPSLLILVQKKLMIIS